MLFSTYLQTTIVELVQRKYLFQEQQLYKHRCQYYCHVHVIKKCIIDVTFHKTINVI